jgi:hypothetical protein
MWFPPRLGVNGREHAGGVYLKHMKFYGQALGEMISHTPNVIQLRNEYGRLCRKLSSAEALELNLNLYVGIGNLRRIRFLDPLSQHFELNAGSRNTQRLKGEVGQNIAHPLIREHRPALERDRQAQ